MSGDTIMRKLACVLALTIGASTGAWAGDEVRLDSPAALEHLRATNPAHYAQAVKILAEANHLCRPAQGELQRARPEDDRKPACAALLLRTSNPPKREVRFWLDHTRYIALVPVTDDPARLIAANGR
jgi:hypothetical protein